MNIHPLNWKEITEYRVSPIRKQEFSALASCNLTHLHKVNTNTSGVFISPSNESAKDLVIEVGLLLRKRDELLDIVMALTAQNNRQTIFTIPPSWEDMVFGQAVIGTALRTPFHSSSF